jgi:glycosyltransferase involved in cell wall biosynthesis
MLTLNIIFPVYNEELRLERGVQGTLAYLREMAFPYRLTIADNGSTDQTPAIAAQLCRENSEVSYIAVREKGVGVAFDAGIKSNKADIVGYMDVDLSTDLRHLSQMMTIFEDDPSVGIVNGTRLAKESKMIGRKWSRRLTSHGLTLALRICLNMRLSDSICGFKFFRKEVAEQLSAKTSQEPGWFRIIEMLIRAEREGIKIRELPVIWTDDPNTTVKVISQVRNYIRCMVRLRRTLAAEAKHRR